VERSLVEVLKWKVPSIGDRLDMDLEVVVTVDTAAGCLGGAHLGHKSYSPGGRGLGTDHHHSTGRLLPRATLPHAGLMLGGSLLVQTVDASGVLRCRGAELIATLGIMLAPSSTVSSHFGGIADILLLLLLLLLLVVHRWLMQWLWRMPWQRIIYGLRGEGVLSGLRAQWSRTVDHIVAFRGNPIGPVAIGATGSGAIP